MTVPTAFQFDPTVAILGLLGFVAHFLGKWKETPLPFKEWASDKQTVIYFLTAGIFCIIALVMQPQWSGAVGMEPNTYSLAMTYGGGHFVSRFLNIKEAGAIKAFTAPHNGTDKLVSILILVIILL